MDTENKSQKSKVKNQKSENKTGIFYITNNGLRLAERLMALYPGARVLKFKSETVSELWDECKDLIFFMATGIVVRTIAALIKDKKTDPAVVVLDEKGEYAISLLGGHLGGANELAKEIADFLGGEAVITTASDVNKLPSIDLWAKENNLNIDDWDMVPEIAMRFLDSGTLKVYSEIEIKLPDGFLEVTEPRSADVLITNKIGCHVKRHLYLRPRNLVIGVGCNSGTSVDEIENAIRDTLKRHNLSFHSIHCLATIDKKGNEPGLITFAQRHGFEIKTFTPDELNSVDEISISEAVFKATGAFQVAEPAAILSSGNGKLFVPKQKIGNVTIAVALRDSYELRVKSDELKEQEPKVRIQKSELNSELKTQNSKLYIVGTGPGSIEHITPYAIDAIKKSDVIVGYGTYLDLIKELIKGKDVISTGMTQEIDRCKRAVELAISGKTVSVISGGDPGIYAMAGLVFEIIKSQQSNPLLPPFTKGGHGGITNSKLQTPCSKLRTIDIEIIPGIPALNACAARLGAPLMHDFACISLSDRLTPWGLIEKRLDAAAVTDFVIVLYNPKSVGRPDHICKARDIILRHRSPETPVGIVKSAMRENEDIIITNIRDMLDHDIDMQTTMIIGNSQTFVWNNWMITPRGYEKKIKV